MNNVQCPCCESLSTYNEWYEISNDTLAVCPSCQNNIEYYEFENGFNKEEL